MVNPTDPNEVRLTGENSFIRLPAGPRRAPDLPGQPLARAGSPAGLGHVLFLKSEICGGEVNVYADNIALARWLQEEIESMLFPEFADQELPVVDAVFSKNGDVRSFWTEVVESEEGTVTLSWYDFAEPFVLRSEACSTPGRPHGVYSCFVPARRAQLTLDGLVALGTPFPEQRGDWESSTACLAWSETWVRPKQ